MPRPDEPNPWIVAGQAAHELFKKSSSLLRAAREGRGWTQEQLAEASGVPRRRISQIENETKNASAAVADSLAAALATTPAALGLTPAGHSVRRSDHPLAVARRAAGLSVGALAARLGWQPAKISRIEHRRQRMTWAAAEALAAELGTSTAAIGLLPEDVPHPLAVARHQAGMTQMQLAEVTGVPRKVIQGIEAKRRHADPTTAELLTAGVGAGSRPLFPRLVSAAQLTGDRLRAERTAVNADLRTLATRAGISVSGLSDIERGASKNPAYHKLEAIHAALIELGADIVPETPFDVAAERDALGLTQRELAEYSGVSRETIAVIETGVQQPGVAVMEALRKGLAAAANEKPLNLTEERARLGLTQAELAERAGLSTGTVQAIEAGARRPEAPTKAALREALARAEADGTGRGGRLDFDLAEARRQLGLTQEALGELAGLTREQISAIERGVVENPTPATNTAIRDALDQVASDREGPGAPLDFDLANAREELGLRREELAERVGLSAQMLGAIERGRTAAPATNTAIRAVLAQAAAERAARGTPLTFDVTQARRAVGLTQVDLAARSGLTLRQLASVENGDTASLTADQNRAVRDAIEQAADSGTTWDGGLTFDLAAVRRELGLSQVQLAERSNLSQQQISALETGHGPTLSGEQNAAIRDALDQAAADGTARGAPLDFDLAEARRQLGLTRADLAERAGLDHGTIERIENGHEGASLPATLAAIRDALDRAVADNTARGAPLDFDLAMARRELNLTQAELADLSGVSESHISDIEQGRVANPKPATNAAIRGVLEQAAGGGARGAPLDFDLAEARTRLGLTRGELAHRANLSVGRIAVIERGAANKTTPATNAAIRDALDQAAADGTAVGRPLDFDLAHVRTALGLTQAGLAERAGLDRSQIAKIEAQTAGNTSFRINAAIRESLAATAGELAAGSGEDVARVRSALGLSADDVAGRAGLARESVLQLEAQARRSRPSTRAAVGDALREAITEFRLGESRTTEPVGNAEAVETKPSRQGEVYRGRAVAELSVAELAALSGVPAREINRIETDAAYRAPESTLRAIREGLHEAEVRRYADVAPDAPAPAYDLGGREADPVAMSPDASVPYHPWVAGGVVVHVPEAPPLTEVPSADVMPPQAQLGPQAAYFAASVQGFAAGRQAGAHDAARAAPYWEEVDPPVIVPDVAGERLAEARGRAADRDIEPDQRVGVDWDHGFAHGPPGTHESAQRADELRQTVFPHTTGNPAPGPQPTPEQVYAQRHAQAFSDGYQAGWKSSLAGRAIAAARHDPGIVDPAVTPGALAEAASGLPHVGPSAERPPDAGGADSDASGSRPSNPALAGLDKPSAATAGRTGADPEQSHTHMQSAPKPGVQRRPSIEQSRHQGKSR